MARAHLQPVYEYMLAFYAVHQHAPTVQQICDGCKLTRAQVGRATMLLTGMGRLRNRIPVESVRGSRRQDEPAQG